MSEQELQFITSDAVKAFYEKNNDYSAELGTFVRKYVMSYLEAKEMANIVVADYIRDVGAIPKAEEK